jgi:hypothetical protein
MAGAPDDDLKQLRDSLLRACEDYDADEAIRGLGSAAEVDSAKVVPPLEDEMPHPADDPRAALAITRGLTSQLQKAKQTGDPATAAAIEAVLIRARRIARPLEQARSRALQATTPPEPQPIPPQPRPPQPPHPNPSPKPKPPRPPVQHDLAEPEGWAEIVRDTRQRRWR